MLHLSIGITCSKKKKRWWWSMEMMKESVWEVAWTWSHHDLSVNMNTCRLKLSWYLNMYADIKKFQSVILASNDLKKEGPYDEPFLWQLFFRNSRSDHMFFHKRTFLQRVSCFGESKQLIFFWNMTEIPLLHLILFYNSFYPCIQYTTWQTILQ